MLTELESRRAFLFFRKDFVIDLTVTNNAYAYLGGDAIYVDPDFHPTIQSTAYCWPHRGIYSTNYGS